MCHNENKPAYVTLNTVSVAFKTDLQVLTYALGFCEGEMLVVN